MSEEQEQQGEMDKDREARMHPHWDSEMLKVLYIGPFLFPTGYGEAARSQARALMVAGAAVMGRLNTPLDPRLSNEYMREEHDINEMLDPRFWPENAEERDPQAVLWHVTPDAMGRVPDKPNLLYAVWETQGLPDGWADVCNRSEGLITSSAFSADLFRSGGVEKPIVVAHHPIDIDRFQPSEEGSPLRALFPNVDTLFLVVSQWMPRKGIEDIIVAYGSEFEPNERTGLVLLTWRWGHSFKERQACRGYTGELLRRLNKPVGSVWLLGDKISPLALPELYRATDCLVTASRGEAFSLPIFEAAASGVPSISTGWGGQWDLLDDETAYRVEYDMETVHNTGANWKHYTAHQKWARPRLDSLRRAMREVHEDPAGRKAKGEKARQMTVERLSPSMTGEQMLQGIRSILDGTT